MQNEIVAEDPFQHIKIRSLIGWLFLGMIPAIIMSFIISELTEVDPSLGSIIILSFLSIWPLFWVLHKFSVHHIKMHQFLGVFPQEKKWLQWIFTVVMLIGFSFGSVYLLWYPLSFPFPLFVDAYFLSKSTFFSAFGVPYPLYTVLLETSLIVLVAPIIEELIFRGVILHRWSVKWGLRKSMIFSSLLFGILHADIIGGVVFGLVMSILYLRTKSLWVPIFCHMLINASALAMEGIIYAYTGPVKETISDFRSDAWIGLVCLVVTAPWVMRFLSKSEFISKREAVTTLTI